MTNSFRLVLLLLGSVLTVSSTLLLVVRVRLGGYNLHKRVRYICGDGAQRVQRGHNKTHESANLARCLEKAQRYEEKNSNVDKEVFAIS